MDLRRDPNLVPSIVEERRQYEQRLSDPDVLPESKHFMADKIAPRAMFSVPFYHRNEPLIYQAIAFGDGAESIHGPHDVSHGLLVTSMQEACRSLAQFWLPESVTYRMKHTSKFFMREQPDGSDDRIPLVTNTAYCAIAMPVDDNIRRAWPVKCDNPETSLPKWVEYGDEGQSKNAMAVFLFRGQLVEKISTRRVKLVFNADQARTKLVGFGFVRFETSDANWQARDSLDDIGMRCRRYSETLRKSGHAMGQTASPRRMF